MFEVCFCCEADTFEAGMVAGDECDLCGGEATLGEDFGGGACVAACEVDVGWVVFCES